MRLLINLLFVLLVSNSVFGQYRYTLSVNPEFRITPILFKTHWAYINEGAITNEDSHLSGSAISYSLSYNLPESHIRFSFGQSFRYDLLYFDYTVNHPSGTVKPIKTLIIDYHLMAEKYFQLSESTEVSVLIGFSLMDTGTDYLLTENYGEYSELDSMNFNFRAYSLAFGISGSRLGLKVGGYFVEQHQFEGIGVENPFIIPFIQLNYKIFRFNNIAEY